MKGTCASTVAAFLALWTTFSVGEASAAAIEQTHEHAGISVHLTLDRDQLRWSDFLTLVVAVHTPSEDQVSMPHVGDLLGDFRVVARKPMDPDLHADGPRTWRREYTLEAQSAGSLSIPALAIDVAERSTVMTADCRRSRECIRQRNRRRTSHAINTRPVTVQVSTLLGSDVDIYAPRDIAQPLELSAMAAGARVWQAALLLMLFALGASAVAWLRRRSAGHAATASPDTAPPTFDPNAALEALAANTLAPIDELYEHLSSIVRDVIAQRYGIATHAATTQQVLAEFDSDASGAQRDRTALLLRACDRVKFAAARPARQVFLDDIEQTRDLIRDAQA